MQGATQFNSLVCCLGFAYEISDLKLICGLAVIPV
jgi:hypothetical protein